MNNDMVRVTFAYPYTSPTTGQWYQPDETADLPAQEALDLLHAGRARRPDSEEVQS